MSSRLMLTSVRQVQCAASMNGLQVSTGYNSKGHDKITAQCRHNSSNQAAKCPFKPSAPSSRSRSSAAAAAVVLGDDSAHAHHHGVKAFEELPIPGGYSKGFMGAVAPAIHALRHGGFKKPHEYQTYTARELGTIYRQRTADGWMVVLSDPRDMETALRRVGKYPKRPSIKPWIDHRKEANMALGLLTSDGAEWQKIRSALHKGILKPEVVGKQVPNMHNIVMQFIDRVRSVRQTDGIIPSIEEELYKWALESSAKFIFDRDLNLLKDDIIKPEPQAFFDALHVLTFKSFLLMMLPEPVLKLLPSSVNPVNLTNKAWDDILILGKQYLDEKMSSIAQAAVRGESLDDGTFVAYLVCQDKLSAEEIYGGVGELLAASVDTTSFTSTWGIHLLSMNEAAQERLYEEVQRVMPPGTPPTREQIDNMPYLKACVKETQRLFPITIGTARILEEDIVVAGYNIPKGTQIQTNFYSACRRDDVFDNALEFRPERWLEHAHDKAYHPFASMPFGHGTRMCVGRRIAQQEMYLLLAEVVRNFKIKPTKPSLESTCGIIINPESSPEPILTDRT